MSKKKEKTQFTKNKNEIGDITTQCIIIKRIIRVYYEQLYTNKLYNLNEMDKFLEPQNTPRLNCEETEKQIRFITRKEIESIIKNLRTMKIQGLDGFSCASTKHLKKN